MKKPWNLWDLRKPLLKYDLKMKLTTLLLITTLFGLHANDSYAQKTKITVNIEDATVRQIIDNIEMNTEFRFIYKTKNVVLTRKLSLNVEEEGIDTVLERLFDNTNTAYKVRGRQIILRQSRKDYDSTQSNLEKVATVQFQERTVSGTVTDDKGVPLPGANIVEKGTTNGVQTDFDGKFSISVSDENAVLMVSYIGFEKMEIAADDESVMNISLAVNAASLEEVVVTGYGTKFKSDVTSSIATVKPQEATIVPTNDLAEMLRGKAAGVQITQGSAAPGSSSNILIRGQRSINGGNSPLVIVDGVPVGDINIVNPNDVASIDILKDAAAQAIYGARASNGVVLITTKTGATGKAQVSYTGFSGIQQITPQFDVFSPQEYIQLKREANRTANGGEYLPDDEIFSPEEQASIASGEFIDWRDVVLKAAPIQDHTISLSAGSEKTKIYTSLNYQAQDGVIPNTDFKRARLRVNLDQTVNDWLKVGINASAQIARRNNPSSAQILRRIVIASPLGQIYNEDGSLKLYPNGFQDLTNPLLDVNEVTRVTDNRDDLYRLFLDISPFDNFNYRINLSRRSYNEDRETYATAQSATGESNGQRGQGNLRYRKFSEWQLENVFTYNLASAKNDLGLTFVQSVIDNTFKGSELDINNTANDILDIYGLRTAESYIPSLSTNKRRLLSFAGSFDYNYDRRYYLTASARVDASSVFGSENKWGFFPAASIGWNVHNEQFLENSETISNLKLRASYGSVGNEGIDPYGSLSTAQQQDYIFGNSVNTGYSPSNTLPNPELKWETSTTLNAAVDFGFFNNRLSGSIEYYDTRTKDLLINRSLNAALGYTNFRDNIGEVKNSGIDFQTNAIVVDKNDLKVDVGVIFSRNRNEIIDLYGTGEDDVANQWFIGEPINVYYTQRGIGIWQEDDDIANSWMPDAQPGDIKVQDVNNDGQLDEDDQVIISQDPDWRGTFSLNVDYKGLDFAMYVMTVQGVTRENVYLNNYNNGGTLRGDRNQIAVDYWLPENPTGTFPRPTEGNDPDFATTIGFQDASYVRLQNVTLGYTLPDTFASKINLSKARVYVTGNNLITKTDYLSYSPEVNPQSYPEAAVVVMGLQIDF